ncbi:uncharacterized protein LOC133534100 [Cydia pomonella]|uniref:uncharacterized protein LOC133534100 n=1 Tax=Cydia pomonella TaxID=82600 RepID=UPI002ADE1C0A|nr:uncharacterized protein LOC133534100 [Cydia pomonella]
MTNILKCSKCNIVVDELLTFVQNKIDVMDEDSLCRICTSAFEVESIEKSKTLLFESIPTEKKRIVRRNRKRTEKQRRDVEDIISLFKGTDPELVPTFVARDIHLLPPVTFDHVDVTDFLKKITVMRAEIEDIKSNFVTQEQLVKLTRKIESFEYRQNTSTSHNGHFLNVNMQRGAFIGDSGPKGFSYCDLSSRRLSDECASPSPMAEEALSERAKKSEECTDVGESTHNGELVLSSSHSQNNSLSASHSHECGDGNQMASCFNMRGLPSNDDVVLSRSPQRSSPKAPPCRLAPVENVEMASHNYKQLDLSLSESVDINRNLSEHKVALQNTGDLTSSDKTKGWEVAESRKHRAKRNRFVGKMGMARAGPDAKFKAAEVKLPLFITKVAKQTTKEDIVEYIEAKTGQKVTMYQINSKDPRKRHNSFKFYVDKMLVPVFLDVKLWPAGIVFRRFMPQKPPATTNAPRASTAASRIDETLQT